MKKSLVVSSALLLATFHLPALQSASAAEIEIAPQVGLSVDPDQFVFGAKAAWSDLGWQSLPSLRFVPGLLVGFGDNVRVIRLSAQFEYSITPGGSSGLELHPIAGLSIANFEIDLDGFCDLPGADCNNTEAGVDLGAGVGYGPFAVDAILGLGDIPDFQLTLSYYFGR